MHPNPYNNPKKVVQVGYDIMAERYLASRDPEDPLALAALEQLAANLEPGDKVLDLGCGAGVPVTEWLARQFRVTGVDISARQLELARERVPCATFIRADMTALSFPPATFSAVVAFYSIIHVPREEQPALLSNIHRWLKPGGLLLALWAVSDWEGTEDNWEGWGAPMWWSHYSAPDNITMLESAGFSILSAELKTSDGETWLWLLAQAAGTPA